MPSKKEKLKRTKRATEDIRVGGLIKLWTENVTRAEVGCILNFQPTLLESLRATRVNEMNERGTKKQSECFVAMLDTSGSI